MVEYRYERLNDHVGTGSVHQSEEMRRGGNPLGCQSPEVVEVKSRLSPDDIVNLIHSEDAQFAVDVPFGWPDTFTDFVVAHRGQAQMLPRDREAWRKETLARRATDQRLARHGALPLPASFDRLGKTAVMWSAIEYDLRQRGVVIDRSGLTGRVCETYPTAALAAWSLGKKEPTLEVIERSFPWLTIGENLRGLLTTDDACDAAVCALMARGKALGITVGPMVPRKSTGRGVKVGSTSSKSTPAHCWIRNVPRHGCRCLCTFPPAKHSTRTCPRRPSTFGMTTKPKWTLLPRTP